MKKSKIAVEILSVTDLDGKERCDPPYHGIRGFLGDVPMIEVGAVMLILYQGHEVTRLTTTEVQEYTFDEETVTHTVRTKNSIYKMKESYNPKSRKRAKAPLYMTSPIGRRFNEDNPDPEGHLLAYGRYRTKIHEADLPEWYVGGYMYKRHGYMSAKGVKHLFYKPDYHFNHLYKYDYLFISYDKEIVPTQSEEGFSWYDGYDYCLSGLIIPEFVSAVKAHSGLNVSGIEKEIEKKRKWYYETYRSGNE